MWSMEIHQLLSKCLNLHQAMKVGEIFIKSMVLQFVPRVIIPHLNLLHRNIVSIESAECFLYMEADYSERTSKSTTKGDAVS